jgi:phosphatidylserine/phosphatidylglycerophosphate/cardiolipin synthase-like enzyme
MQYKFLLSPWKNEFINAISETKKELFVSSPFINIEGVRILSNAVQTKSSIEISLVTNLTTQNIVNGITEPAALLELYKQFVQVKISSLGRLHAKVYLIDDRIGIITSANLTKGGLVNNFEYGVLIDDKSVICAIKEDMLKYYSLGNVFDKNLLEKSLRNLIRYKKSKIGPRRSLRIQN